MKNSPALAHWKSSQLMNNNDYEIAFYKDKDFKKVSLHSHDFYELYFFINGNASYIIEDSYYTLQSGDILLISPRDLHQLDINDAKATYERIVLWLNPRYLKELSTPKTNLAECFELSYKCKNYLIRDYPLSETIKTDLEELCAYSSSGEFGADVAAEILIRRVLLRLAVHARSADCGNGQRNLSAVSKTMNYICENIDGQLSLDNIAEAMFISKFHLSRIFKKETNTTIHQYILKKRLIMSKQLIEKKLPITEVYQKCGFADYTHFFRAFKHEYGITPKQYLNFTRK